MFVFALAIQPVAIVQAQQPVLVASGNSSLVLSRPRQSSAQVGWIPTTESRIVFVIPHLKPMATPWVISPAFGAQIWKPTTRSSCLLTSTLVYAVRFPSVIYLSKAHSRGWNFVWYVAMLASPNLSFACSSVRPTVPYSIGVKTVVGTSSWFMSSVPLPANLAAKRAPVLIATGVNSRRPFCTSPTA